MVSCSLLVLMQKITFIVKKIRKNCCKQSCSFLAQISLESLQRSPGCLAVFMGPTSKEKKGGKEDGRKERERKGED